MLRARLYVRPLLIQQSEREAKMVLERAGAGSEFGEFFGSTVADGENIVERKSETRAIPPWFAHRKIIQSKSLRVAIRDFAYRASAS